MLKEKIIYILLLLTSISFQSHSQESDIEKYDLYGRWICIDKKQTDNRVIDSVVFFPDNRLTIHCNGVISKGEWRLKGHSLKLKSCVHSIDNPYKCRENFWDYNLTLICSDTLIFKTVNNDELKYVFRTLKGIFPKIDSLIDNSLIASSDNHPYSANLEIYSDYMFSYNYYIHQAGPLIANETKGTVKIKSEDRLILKIDKKKFKTIRYKNGELIDLDNLNKQVKRLIIKK